MKLLEILQKELKQFPEGMLYAVQDDDGEVKFGKHSRPTLDDSGIWQRNEDAIYPTIARLELAEDWDSAIVTKDMWESAQQVLEMAGMTKKREVRKDFDPKKKYSVNVSGRSEKIKKEVQQAFFDAGFPWKRGGSNEYQHLHAMMYTNMTGDGLIPNFCMFGTSTEDCNITAEEFLELVYEPEKREMEQIIVNVVDLVNEEKKRIVEALAKITDVKMCNPRCWDNVAILFGPSFDGKYVGWDYYKPTKPTHTPQQVLEMAGIEKKRKVRKGIDPKREYNVDVTGCTDEVKKTVQQAFFDIGFLWADVGNVYQYLAFGRYTNTTDDGRVTGYCMYGSTTSSCNMTPKEFLELIYEPENQGHVHAELMAQYAEDAKNHKEPWQLWECNYISFGWQNLTDHPQWLAHLEYRRKVETHFVHGVEIPDLRIKEEPKPHTLVVLADPIDDKWYAIREWQNVYNGIHKHRLLKLGLLYENTPKGREAAILHAKIMLGIA